MSKVLDLVSHIIGGKTQNNLNLLTLIANKLGSSNIQCAVKAKIQVSWRVLSRINHVSLFFFFFPYRRLAGNELTDIPKGVFNGLVNLKTL